MFSEPCGQLQQSNRAGAVVIRAIMNAARVAAFGIETAVIVSEMVIVRTNHDVLGILRVDTWRQNGDDVVIGSSDFFHGGLHADLHSGQGKPHRGVWVFPVECILHFF